MNPIQQVPAEYLRRAAATPAIRAIKQRAYALMGLFPGAAALDIGCGPGVGTVDLAHIVGPFGQVWGVDRDAAMLREADQAAQAAGIAAWTAHREADATALPFADGTFHACCSDRLLQHVPPDAARRCIAEAARVLRPGGAMVMVDSDWGSFSVDCADAALERRMQALHLRRFENPFSGRTLGRIMTEAGLGFVGVEPFAAPLTGAQAANLLAPTLREAARAGTVDETEAGEWRAAMAAWPAARVVAHLTIVLAAGVRA
ncbi:MAG: methyltransferase domain-containing protein [Proteobacteria bacterium]|nr:methyltransferase domain-containing protein [Pseudomonadota bacterium]